MFENQSKSQSMEPQDPIGDLDMKSLHIWAALGTSTRPQPTAVVRHYYKPAKAALGRKHKTADVPSIFAGIASKAVVAPAIVSPNVISRAGQSEADLPKASVSKADLPKAGWPIDERITVTVASDLEQCMDSLIDIYDDKMSISDVSVGPESGAADVAGGTGLHLPESTKAALDGQFSFIIALSFTVSWFDDVSERPAGWNKPRSWNSSSSRYRTLAFRKLAQKKLETIEEE